VRHHSGSVRNKLLPACLSGCLRDADDRFSEPNSAGLRPGTVSAFGSDLCVDDRHARQQPGVGCCRVGCCWGTHHFDPPSADCLPASRPRCKRVRTAVRGCFLCSSIRVYLRLCGTRQSAVSPRQPSPRQPGAAMGHGAYGFYWSFRSHRTYRTYRTYKAGRTPLRSRSSAVMRHCILCLSTPVSRRFQNQESPKFA
jgi:hypothetical protein